VPGLEDAADLGCPLFQPLGRIGDAVGEGRGPMGESETAGEMNAELGERRGIDGAGNERDRNATRGRVLSEDV